MSFTARPVSMRTMIARSQPSTSAVSSIQRTLGGTIASLSPGELRRRRLLALGVASDQSEKETKEPSTISDPQNKSSSPELIDLCESSSDDDDYDRVRQFKKVKTSASTDSSTAQKSAKECDNVESEDDESSVDLLEAFASGTNSKVAARQRKLTSTSRLDTKTISSPQRFKVATYNLWFQPVHVEARMKAIARILLQQHQSDRNNPLLMIGFQEVTDELGQELFPLLKDANYRIIEQATCQYGCALAVAPQVTVIDSGFVPYRTTIMSRGFMYARLQLTNSSDQWLFTTTHLESWAGDLENGETYTGAVQRQEQILQLQTFCQEQLAQHPNLQCAVITGDLNWDDERVRGQGPDPTLLAHLKSNPTAKSSLNSRWKDSWKDLYPRKDSVPYTYDAKLNPMLGGNLRRRFDRILLLEREKANCATDLQSAKFLGTEALPGLTWKKTNPYTRKVRSVPVAPSDHFGLLLQLGLQRN